MVSDKPDLCHAFNEFSRGEVRQTEIRSQETSKRERNLPNWITAARNSRLEGFCRSCAGRAGGEGTVDKKTPIKGVLVSEKIISLDRGGGGKEFPFVNHDHVIVSPLATLPSSSRRRPFRRRDGKTRRKSTRERAREKIRGSAINFPRKLAPANKEGRAVGNLDG